MRKTLTDPIVIVSAARTPIGSFQGALSTLKAPELGALAIKTALERSALSAKDIDEILMGCVVSAGLGQAPARQAALIAGMPTSVSCTTVNKVCGSGMKAIMLAHDLILSGSQDIIIAGGMESVSNAPYLLPKARQGLRMGHAQCTDALFQDGLEDPYEGGQLMGVYAERTAEKYGFTRKAQDDYAILSLSRAKAATDNGWFLSNTELFPMTIQAKTNEMMTISQDEQPFKAKIDRIPTLKPSFKEGGTVTAANSSSISDGAAAVVLMRLSEATKRNLRPLAKILMHSSHAQEPGWFTTAPIGAIQTLLKKLEWTTETPDLYEINEAFAAVTMAAMHDLSIPNEKCNIHGGGCALGHPLGATGARIVITLLGALTRLNKSLGVAALCIGGGEATAIAIERMEN